MKWLFAASALVATAAPCLGASDVAYAPPDTWIMASPEYALPERKQGAFTLLYRDQQVHRGKDGIAVYESSRFRINTAEALAMGNLSIQWNPAAGGPTVHALRIFRDGQVIDVLEKARFSIFQREGSLEQSMLDGLLTANLQVPDLRVGDEVEFSLTTRSLDPTLPDHAFGLMVLPEFASPGTYRMALRWDPDHPLAWRASPDLEGLARAQGNSVTVELKGPTLVTLPEGAPARYALQRFIDFSDFDSWASVSRRIYPLYTDAARLAPKSGLKEEAARIMAAHADQAGRARAALRLVQDQVRYVYAGMNGGNLTPATADETWQRRFGDCKGKTAMLLALLAEMGIEAEPVLANITSGGDIAQRLLPGPAAFDHVMVRAKIDGRPYWMDGTLQGDSRLLDEPLYALTDVLPLRADGAGLERLPYTPPAHPSILDLHLIDATAGMDQPVGYSLTRILRGGEALQLRAALQALPEGGVEPALHRFFGGESSWEELQEVDWRYDDNRGALILTAKGTDVIDWGEETVQYINRASVPAAGFNPPPERKRPASQDRSAPYANAPRRFACYVTTIRLPQTDEGQGWKHTADAMNRTIGGVAYWRMVDLRDGELHSVMSTRTQQSEISAEDAAAANAEIPDFDNAVTTVELRREAMEETQLAVADDGIDRVPAITDADWLDDSSACIAPGLRTAGAVVH